MWSIRGVKWTNFFYYFVIIIFLILKPERTVIQTLGALRGFKPSHKLKKISRKPVGYMRIPHLKNYNNMYSSFLVYVQPNTSTYNLAIKFIIFICVILFNHTLCCIDALESIVLHIAASLTGHIICRKCWKEKVEDMEEVSQLCLWFWWQFWGLLLVILSRKHKEFQIVVLTEKSLFLLKGLVIFFIKEQKYWFASLGLHFVWSIHYCVLMLIICANEKCKTFGTFCSDFSELCCILYLNLHVNFSI